uniref:Uncharacterized protein n=1 Tax=Oryza glumipatula TaxID=40148 RepID=A0A0E0BK57_9ORYZ
MGILVKSHWFPTLANPNQISRHHTRVSTASPLPPPSLLAAPASVSAIAGRGSSGSAAAGTSRAPGGSSPSTDAGTAASSTAGGNNLSSPFLDLGTPLSAADLREAAYEVRSLTMAAASKGGSPGNGGGGGAMSAPPPWPAMVGELLTIGEQTVGLLRIAESQVNQKICWSGC